MTTPDPLYVAARRILLDALQTLGEHRNAVVLVGAQAIYLQVGDADFEVTVAPYTTDADLGLDPALLGPDPKIVEAMGAAGFTLKVKSGGGIEPGIWQARTTVEGTPTMVSVDLLVPEQLATGHGRRDARLPDHGKNATRWTPGIEATVYDNTEMPIVSLEPDRDPRRTTIRVAGPSALLIAKSHKIADRIADGARGRGHRIKPKDCADVIRLMRSPVTPAAVGARLGELAEHPACAANVPRGVSHLVAQFGRPTSVGVELAVQSLAGALPEDQIRALAPAYVDELLTAYQGVG
ncbi:hypothetical protein [Actinoplanes sp. NPDC026619]|uniref:hypothetical protein n=1 Tax=Actinoplanes sp. NPDC026619 TaxID=3155798 RepID=UPI0033E5E391